MTMTFSVDASNDLFIGRDGNLSISTGIEAVKQACQQAASTQRGQMVLRTDQGIPNFQVIWVGVPNIAQFTASIRQALLSVTDVTSVESLDVTQNGDVLEYIAVIDTVYGQGTVNG